MNAENDIAFINYRMRDGFMLLTHSEVPYALRGLGIGKVLVEKTFEYIEEHNINAVAICSFIKIVSESSSKWKEIIK